MKLFRRFESRMTAVDSRRHLWLASVPPRRLQHHDHGFIKRGKVANKRTVMVRCNTSLINLLTSLISYRHAFRAEYHVSFLDGWINDTLNGLIFSDFLSLDSRSTYDRYICVPRVVSKQSTLFPLLAVIFKEDAETRNLRATHADGATI